MVGGVIGTGMVGGGPVGGGPAGGGVVGTPQEGQNRSVSLTRCAPHDVQNPTWNPSLRWAAPRRT